MIEASKLVSFEDLTGVKVDMTHCEPPLKVLVLVTFDETDLVNNSNIHKFQLTFFNIICYLTVQFGVNSNNRSSHS